MPRRAPDVIAAYNGTGQRLKAPKDLDPAAAGVFAQLISALPAGFFETSDLPVIELYCRCVVGERLAYNEMMVATDLEVRGKWLREWTSLARQIGTAARRLRINPSGRGEIRSGTEQPATRSYYDQMEIAGKVFRDEDDNLSN